MADHDAHYLTLIDSSRIQKEYLKDLFRYRELFYFFALRDIIVRYKQAFFGIAWAIIRPLLNMIVFAFLFGKIANLPSDNVSYALFVLAGMLPWQLFSNSLVETCSCLVTNSQLVSKIYFPRMIIPTAQIIVHLVDFAITAVLLLILGILDQAINFWTLMTFPLFLLLVSALCVGTGLWLSALTVQYRDFRIIVPFLVQFGMFVSPVGYGTFIIPEKWQLLYFMNPMVGVIDGFRWCFFGITHPMIGFSLGFSVAITLILLVSGFFYFRRMERTFADNI
jgi:lipopolysaccharide transport system permease protein